MARLAPARAAALKLVAQRRRQEGRMRDLARGSAVLEELDERDRTLAFRLALGVTGLELSLDQVIDGQVRRPSRLEPRVRDALRLAVYELCYLETEPHVCVSQGVELVRSVAPRAAGLANATLRRIAERDRPQLQRARTACAQGLASEEQMSLAAGLPFWLVARLVAERGSAQVCALCASQLEPAPVYMAPNTLRMDEAELIEQLTAQGMDPHPLDGLDGCVRLGQVQKLAATGLLQRADIVVADAAAQLVCRVASLKGDYTMLEVGQGRGTKSLLVAAGPGLDHPRLLHGVENTPYKVRLSRERMRAAGLSDVVSCWELDGRLLGSEAPAALPERFDAVLLDAPCSGTGTMRRHPEIPAILQEEDVTSLARLQLELLEAASTRVALGGQLVYATCSVLREEDEAVVEAFLASPAGSDFVVAPVTGSPACQADTSLADLVDAYETTEGFFLSLPSTGSCDGHFCARLLRS